MRISSLERPAAAVASVAFLAANTILAKRVYDVALPVCKYLVGSLDYSYLDVVSYTDLAAFGLGMVATGIVSWNLAKMAYNPEHGKRIPLADIRLLHPVDDSSSSSGNQSMSEISAFHDGEGQFIGTPKGASQ